MKRPVTISRAPNAYALHGIVLRLREAGLDLGTSTDLAIKIWQDVVSTGSRLKPDESAYAGITPGSAIPYLRSLLNEQEREAQKLGDRQSNINQAAWLSQAIIALEEKAGE